MKDESTARQNLMQSTAARLWPTNLDSFSRFRLPLLATGFALALGAGAIVRGYRTPAVPDVRARAAESGRTPPGMVYVPGGWCWIGTNDADADDDVKPMRRVFVRSFYIDRTEVTNREFKRFRPAHDYPKGEDDLPVTNITYDDAAAFARWAGKRLPTGEEWEKAARGTDGRRYPWGDTWDATRVTSRARRDHDVNPPILIKRAGACAIGPSRVRAVGSLPAGASPYGCLDMAGNAWEWVQGFYNGNVQQRLLRGGAVGYAERGCRTYEYAIESAGAT